MKQARIAFEISLPKLDTEARLRAYIIDAVESWSGQFDPYEDPLFGTLRGQVRLVRRRKRT